MNGGPAQGSGARTNEGDWLKEDGFRGFDSGTVLDGLKADTAFSHTVAFSQDTLSDPALGIKPRKILQATILCVSPKHMRQSSCSPIWVMAVHFMVFLKSALVIMLDAASSSIRWTEG